MKVVYYCKEFEGGIGYKVEVESEFVPRKGEHILLDNPAYPDSELGTKTSLKGHTLFEVVGVTTRIASGNEIEYIYVEIKPIEDV